MALVFERIQTKGIAELLYLIGDDSAGLAAVVDPTPDVDKYMRLARQHGRAVTSVCNVPGSWQASQQVGLPTARQKQK